MAICTFCGNVVDPGCPCPVCDHVAPPEKSSSTKSSVEKTTTTKSTVKKTTTVKSKPAGELNLPLWLFRLLATFLYLFFGLVNISYLGQMTLRSFFTLSGMIRVLLICAILFFSLINYGCLFEDEEKKPSFFISYRDGIRQARKLLPPTVLSLFTLGAAEFINHGFLTNGYLFLRLLAVLIIFMCYLEGPAMGYYGMNILCNLYLLDSVREKLHSRIPQFGISYSHPTFFIDFTPMVTILFIVYSLLLILFFFNTLNKERKYLKRGRR